MLERVPSAEEIRAMNKDELRSLAQEIRQFIIEKTSVKGGHLASNLGAVELTLALFSVFDFPHDRVIFDVGHQSYTYKILSGRKDGFDHLRDLNGISGFPKRKESPYDSFDTGHSSTSVSAGLGMVMARDLQKDDYHVISVIGDGSFTGGEVFEALNNAAALKSNYIILLNDNEMSISRNVGGLNRYLTNLRAGKGYNRLKDIVKQAFRKLPGLIKGISNFKDSIKEILMPRGMFFENIGIKYFGPVDGHNIPEMQRILQKAKDLNRCVLIHVKTMKGKGYEPSEKKPEWFHGVNAFDIATGLPLKAADGRSYSAVFGNFIDNAALTHPKIVAITAAMTENVGLTDFAAHFPERFFDVGIAEGHAVTFAAGLATSGLHPYFAVFSSFLQRGYDQIVHDVCMQDLPVTFCIDRAGIVGRDGETHQGAFDLAYLSGIPNMTVMAPRDALEMEEMLSFTLDFNRPSAVRYPRGKAKERLDKVRPQPIVYGEAELIERGSKIAVLSFGDRFNDALETVERLKQRGYRPSFVNMRFAKPWDEKLVDELSNDTELFITMEDGAIFGGIGEKISAHLSEKGYHGTVRNIGIPDRFVPQGNPDELYHLLKMDADGVMEIIENDLVQIKA